MYVDPLTYVLFLIGLQYRLSTAMDVAPVESTESPKELDMVNNKNLTRYRRRFMKRQWEETTKKENEESGESTEKKVCERIKRKKMAVLLGYSGVDYFGMQRYLLN